jgi:Ca2+-binding EF-hand superfamily protein
MNKMRLNLIEMAFKKLDKTSDGVVTIDDLKGVYNIRSHPEYQNGQKTEKELLEAFLKKFEEGGSVDGKVYKLFSLNTTKTPNNTKHIYQFFFKFLTKDISFSFEYR